MLEKKSEEERASEKKKPRRNHGRPDMSPGVGAPMGGAEVPGLRERGRKLGGESRPSRSRRRSTMHEKLFELYILGQISEIEKSKRVEKALLSLFGGCTERKGQQKVAMPLFVISTA